MIHFFKEGCLIGVNDTLPNKIMRSGKGCNTEENDKTKPITRPNQTNVPFKNISHTEWLSIKGTSKQTQSDDLVMCRPQLQSRHHCSQTGLRTKNISVRRRAENAFANYWNKMLPIETKYVDIMWKKTTPQTDIPPSKRSIKKDLLLTRVTDINAFDQHAHKTNVIGYGLTCVQN